MSQLTLVIRPMYSNPSGQGSKIVGKILGDPTLYGQWISELRQCVMRLRSVRARLRDALESSVPGRDWSPITKQLGMFYFSDLTTQQGAALMEKHHIYILSSSGRINVGALTDRNLDYVAAAIASVVRNT
jgi:aspartate/tyrosine/aromatic aminotransferase